MNAVLNKTTTFEEFSALLMQEHGIAVKESRGRLSYCPPGRAKFITAKKLSKKLDAEYQTLSSEKNGFYTRYKKAQIELRELRTAQQNVEAFFRKEERSHAVPQQEVK